MPMQEIAKQMVALNRGVLAADESTGTIGKRFVKINTENTEENRRDYREMLFTAPGMEQYISGVIMYDETIRQSAKDGRSFVKVLQDAGVIPGIKVDKGTVTYDESDIEKITLGLEGLDERMKEYYKMGARFAKWRAVFSITDTLPSSDLIKQNAKTLAEYASICQQKDIVPIVEPEVLMDGTHDIKRCYEVTKNVLTEVFAALKNKGAKLDCLLLKPNMVISGASAESQASPKEVAEWTVKCLKETVPASVAGIVFLSGGQTEMQACETLNEINKICDGCPWQLSFSYGRALQNSALQTWNGTAENISLAQEAFLKQAKLVSLARMGVYN